MVRERRNSLASFRTLVFAWGLQSSACGPCVAVSRVGAVLLHRCHNPGRAGTGYCFLLCQSGFELFASENTRAALDGASRTHVAGDEPMLTALTLAALNLAVRLPGMRRREWASAWIGLLFTLMMLTKTTAVFLLPALGW